MAELKPCPWCSENKWIGLVSEEGLGCDFHYVYCHVCRARGPYNIEKQAAIDAWNKRIK